MKKTTEFWSGRIQPGTIVRDRQGVWSASLRLLGGVVETSSDTSDHRSFPVASAWPRTYSERFSSSRENRSSGPTSARVATLALAANGALARVGDVASSELRDFSEATGRDCSSSTTSVNRRGPPSMSRAELGIHGLKAGAATGLEKSEKRGVHAAETVRHHGRRPLTFNGTSFSLLVSG